MKNRENIVIADCCAEEVESLTGTLNFGSDSFVTKSHIANWKRTGKLSELRRYGKYFSVAFKYFLSRKNYNVIIGWQQFYTLIFCFYCSIFRVKKSNTVVALNFTYKEKNGKAAKLYKWFMSKCLETGYIDYIHVPSDNYADIVSEMFSFPRENIIVSPFGINDPYDKFSQLSVPTGVEKDGYALAIGRSNRDYDFLIEAWKNIDYPLVIISDTYVGDNRKNPNISILKNVAGAESYPWIAHCNIMIIPIDDGSICSGDTVLLTSMAMKKKILVTTPSTLAEMYIVNENNGLTVEKDTAKFCSIVNDMLHTDKYNYLSDSARDSYLNNYSRKSMGKKVSEFIGASLS